MADLGPTLTDRDTDVLGDAFGEVAEMAHWVAGGMSPVLDHATVGSDISRDARIVGRQCGRKKSSANETVGRGFGKG